MLILMPWWAGVIAAIGVYFGTGLLTTSSFTKDYESFAAGKPIRLIDGKALLPLVQSVQKKPTTNEQSNAVLASSNAEPATMICKLCGSPMVLRTAKRGPNSGNPFWGCSKFPKCRQTAETW